MDRHHGLPVIIAPTVFHRLSHPDAERATARATARAGVVVIAVMAAIVPLAELVVPGGTARDRFEPKARNLLVPC